MSPLINTLFCVSRGDSMCFLLQLFYLHNINAYIDDLVRTRSSFTVIASWQHFFNISDDQLRLFDADCIELYEGEKKKKLPKLSRNEPLSWHNLTVSQITVLQVTFTFRLLNCNLKIFLVAISISFTIW
jgi:hypothetical protein